MNEEPGSNVEDMAVFVHGSLAALHGIGMMYHLKRGRYGHALIHGAVLAYDLVSVLRHYRRMEDEDNRPD